MYFNGQSLYSNLRQLKAILQNVNVSLIFVSEARIPEDIRDNEINIKNYNVYRTNSESKRTGGVVMYVRKDISVKSVDRLSVESNFWLLALTVTINDWNGIVACVYRSPSCRGEQENMFINDFIKWCDDRIDETDNIVICGDFNINWLKDSAAKKKLCEGLNDLNLLQIVKQPTRITESSTTLIDFCITNDKSFAVDIRSDLNISDHETFIIKSNKIIKRHVTEKIMYSMKNYDSIAFQNELKRCDWSIGPSMDVIDRAHYVINNLKNTINKFIIKKKCKINTKCAWYNEQLEMIKCDKINACNRAKLTDDPIDRELYKSLRNFYLSNLRETENNYYSEKVLKNRGDPKKMWNVLKEIMGKRVQNTIKSVKIDNNIFSDKHTIAEKLNSYFIQSIEKINSSIPPPSVIASANNINNTTISVFKFKSICINDIVNAINQIKSDSDMEWIKPSVLLDSLPIIGDEFCAIINETFTKGIFPEWKCSTVVPVEKVSGTIEAEEFRPINCMPTYEKVIEIIVKSQLDEYLEMNNIIVGQQSGFRKNHSCETALNRVINDWKSSLEEGKFIICTFLDLKRAFETIERKILIEKLDNLGIRGKEKEWFVSYLSNRSQRTKIDDVFSQEISNNIGVPQGTVLAGTLFTIVINDICKLIENQSDINMSLFADDTAIYMATNDIKDGELKMNAMLLKVQNYLRKNKLKINTGKTKFMILKNRCKKIDNDEIKLYIENDRIECVDNIKYLGIVLDEELNFNKHVDFICKKISSKVGLLHRIKNKMKTEDRITIYKTIIAPHFEYCPTLLYLLNESQINRVQKLQNRGMRAVMRVNKRTSVKLMLETLNWLSFRQRTILRTMQFIHNICLGKSPDYLSNYILRNGGTHSYTLRDNDDLVVRGFLRRNTQNSLLVKGFKQYNSLPNEIKNTVTLNRFSTLVKIWILNNIPI